MLNVSRVLHGLAVLGVVHTRPLHFGAGELGTNNAVRQRRVEIGFVMFSGAHAHIARRHIRLALGRRSRRTIFEDAFIEAQQAHGLAIALVVMPDTQRHGLAQHGRDLALRQEVAAVEARLGHAHAIGLGALGIHQHIGGKVLAQHRQVQTFVDAVGTRNHDQERVGLLGRPARHVSGTQIDGKQLLPRDLGHAIAPVAQLPACQPAAILPCSRLDHGGKRLFQRAHAGNHPQSGGSLQKAAPTQI